MAGSSANSENSEKIKIGGNSLFRKWLLVEGLKIYNK